MHPGTECIEGGSGCVGTVDAIDAAPDSDAGSGRAAGKSVDGSLRAGVAVEGIERPGMGGRRLMPPRVEVIGVGRDCIGYGEGITDSDPCPALGGGRNGVGGSCHCGHVGKVFCRCLCSMRWWPA